LKFTIVKPKPNDMYELSQEVCLVFKTPTEKIYARSVDDVTISTTENIPDPSAQDIAVTPNSTGGKDIEIILRVLGSPSIPTQVVTKTVDVEIIDAGEELDEEGVRTAVGSKVYNITVKVYKNGTVQSTSEEGVSDKSKVIIE
jgi:hypothetical protein